LFTKRTDKHWWYLHAQWNPWSGDNMNEDKTTISQAQSYQAIGEFWDTHDLGEFWEQTAPAEFDVDIRSETTYYAVESSLSLKLRRLAQQQGISAETLLNLWVQEKTMEIAVAD
jgi:hypothetical protein